MHTRTALFAASLAALALVLGGCKTGAVGSVDAGPFMFKATGAREACFIEAVRFHDEYYSNRRTSDGWMRIMQWGVKEGFTVNPGHAIAVFEWNGKLALYDTNGGVIPLAVDPALKMDLTEVGPPVFRRYPKIQPTGAEYMLDVHRRKEPGIVIPRDFPNIPRFYPLLRAAKSIARYREVRVYRFAYTSEGQERESAAVAFMFDGHLCVYVPEKGTLLRSDIMASPDNARMIRARIERAFGDGSNVRFVGASAG